MRHIYLLLLPFFIITSAFAQDATVRGFVYDEKSGEPVIFTNVYLKGTMHGTSTDVNGYYSITKVPPGNYTLTVSALGYDSIQNPISLSANQILNKNLYAVQKAVSLQIVDVSAEREEARNEVKMSVQKITPKEIESLPSIGGEADIAQYMQVLPGVIFTGDQGGQLYIRGGSPIQNKVLLDGMIVYNPFHSIGLFSVFDTDIIRNADIYTGGFNARYGGRISSIMDITTKDGRANEFQGKLSASTFGAKLTLDGPLQKPKKLGGSYSSYIISAKHSYLNETSKVLYDYVDTNGLPFQYSDFYGKLSFNSENGSKFSVFGLHFNDKVNYQAISDLNWRNAGVGANFLLVPTGNPVLIEGYGAYSSYHISLQEANLEERFSSVKGMNFGLDFTYFLGDDEIKYGLEVVTMATDFQFFNASNRKISQQQSTTELAFYGKYKKKIGRLIVEPSLRIHYYASLSHISPEPRLGAKFNVSENFRLKLAAGMYSQNLISANSDRDVVNLFYGFLSGPDNLQDEFTNENGDVEEIRHKLQKANHLIAGFEYDITRRVNLNVEGYYKRFSQLTNLNRNKIFDESDVDRPEIQRKDFIVETGDAYGVDFVIKYDHKDLSLYGVYSLGKVTRWDGLQEYFPIFDRRHNVNFVGSYAFGKTRLWEFSARWNLGSGFPFTQTQGFYEKYTFADGTATDVVNGNGDVGILYGELNGGRLPYYHRLDVTLKRQFVLSENSILEANVGITNMYDRENIFYFDRVNYERVDQLPFMPNAGLSLTF